MENVKEKVVGKFMDSEEGFVNIDSRLFFKKTQFMRWLKDSTVAN